MDRTMKPPAEIGMEVIDIDTPALIIDLDRFESNLDLMSREVARLGVSLRPHAKTHKSADVAKAQLLRGAVGVCCQKVSEAEALANNGVNNILITNQIVGRHKIDRLVELSRNAEVSVCVDNSENIADLNSAASSANLILNVLVEIDVGGGRCGAPPGQPTVDLACEISNASHLIFSGLQAYNGQAQELRCYLERRQAIENVCNTVNNTIGLLKENGLYCELITGSGTGTWEFEGASQVYTEIQAGSYVFMDASYLKNEDVNGQMGTAFKSSLYIYTMIMSINSKNYAVVDAGLKSIAFDQGMPVVVNNSDANYYEPSDEHGLIGLDKSAIRYAVGDKIMLVPGHCDPTVNLHNWYVCIRNDRVEQIWDVTGRGALY